MLSNVSRTYHVNDDVTENNLPRRASFSPGDIRFFSQKIQRIANTPSPLIRHAAYENLSLLNESAHNDFVGVEFHLTPAHDIDIENYIYAGALKGCAMGNIGITLDDNGHLILIKGKSFDLFHGLWRKYTHGYSYQTARLVPNHGDLVFKHLYVDDNGLLIGREKETKKDYTIALSPITMDTLSNQQVIHLAFHLENIKNQRNNLTFQTNNYHTVSYFKKDDALYCTILKKKSHWHTPDNLTQTINVPLYSGYHLDKIKRTMGGVQAVIQQGDKKRIVFIDPKQSVNKISHKPPQAFANRLGHDPHEKYHAGFPFTSDRKSNFSSKKIPLFSTLIDNFRVNIKAARHSPLKRSQKLIHVVKGIDPGCQAVYTSLPQLANAINVFGNNEKDSKEKLYSHHVNLIRKQSSHLAKVANEALGSEEPLNFSQTLLRLAQELNVHETLALGSTHSLATFFGVASGGFPFVTGWFSGLVLELSNRYSLIMSKTATGAIALSFNHRHKTAATALAGTGQGLEQTLTTLHTIDYLTVMPFEANAIMAAQVIKEDCFKFTLSEDHFKEFAEQFADRNKGNRVPSIFISEAEAIKNKARQFVLKVEARNELRLQAGSMVNPTTYMVFPRTAVGARLACDLLNIKQEKSAAMAPTKQTFSPNKQSLIITSLNTEANPLAEWKIMPIAMHGGGDQTLWCYPLPILEETRALRPHKQQSGVVLLEKSVDAETASSREPARELLSILGTDRVSTSANDATIEMDQVSPSPHNATVEMDQASTSAHKATVEIDQVSPSPHNAAVEMDQASTSAHKATVEIDQVSPSPHNATVEMDQASTSAHKATVEIDQVSTSAHKATVEIDQVSTSAHKATVEIDQISPSPHNATVEMDQASTSAYDATVDSLPASFSAARPTSTVNLNDNIQITKKITDIMNTPVFLSVNNKGELKSGLNIKQLAMVDRHIKALETLLSPLCKSLATQQRSSQHKVCVIDIIAHYHPLAPLSDLNKRQETTFLLTPKDANSKTSYRLEKLSFQRTSTLQHKKATIPMPIFNVATAHALSHTQPLGTIEIIYKSARELSPINITHQLNVLY